MYVKYLNNEPFKISTGSLKKCALGKLLGKVTNEFKVKIGQRLKDDKRDLIIIDRKIIKDKKGQNKKYYQYKCNKCGFECEEHYKNGEYQEELWMGENELLMGNGCSACCPNPQVVVQGINDIPTTAPWMVKYFQNPEDAKKYTKTSHKKIVPICTDCGRVRSKSIRISYIYIKHSVGCSCSDGQSYPNKFCFNLLEQLSIKFETEYSPEWIKPKRYDFYFELNNKKYIVEMDGSLGHGNTDNLMNGQTKEESKEIDNYKDRLAKENNVKVIRIDSQTSEVNYIKNNILNSELNELFNLSDVDWLECEEFALSNLVKKACELKRDNSDITTLDIANILKLNKRTIAEYLKKGSKIWNWINYNPKEERNKGNRKAVLSIIKSCSKPIAIFKDGIKLDEFESIADLSRKSEEMFNVKLHREYIWSVCKEKQKQYKGFTFKYI